MIIKLKDILNEKKKKDDKIQVRGLGTWDYKSLTSNLARKIKTNRWDETQ